METNYCEYFNEYFICRDDYKVVYTEEEIKEEE